MNIEIVRQYCKPGVYVLINPIDKRVFVSYSLCISESVCRNVKEMICKTHKSRLMSDDLNKLSFVLHSEESDEVLMRLECTRLMDDYKSKGYTLYNDRYPLKYSIKWNINGNGLVMVYLVSQRNKKIVIGVFRTKDEMESFISNSYPNPDSITNIVYDKGEKTVAYYLKRKWILP